MGSSLKLLCENCPERTKPCTRMCKELAKEVRRLEANKGEPVGNRWTTRSIQPREGAGEDSSASPVNAFSSDVTGNVDLTYAPEPIFEVDDEFRKVLRKAITEATFGRPKLRKQFYAFIGCSPMARVARLAGVTKQNVQKQFSVLMEEIAGKMRKDWPPSTPGQFKKRATN